MPDSKQLVAAMMAEIASREEPIEMVLRPLSALHLAGLLQLALRHPGTRTSEAHDADLHRQVRTLIGPATSVHVIPRGGTDPQ